MSEVNIDVAKQTTSDEINSKLGLTDDTNGSSTEGTMQAKMNASLLKMDGLNIDINNINARLDGQSTPYGMGTYGDIVVTENFVWPSLDGYNRLIIHAKSLTIPEGVTIKPPVKCDGVYILSQGDVTINGNIDVRGMRKTFDSDIQMSPTINIGATEYTLAKGGYSPKGGNSGANGDIKYVTHVDEGYPPSENDWITYAVAGTVPTNSCAGNINGGGVGGYGVASSAAEVAVSFGWDSDDDGHSHASLSSESVVAVANTYDIAPTALVIIAQGNITINGNILASGTDGVNAEDGGTYVNSHSGVRHYSYRTGRGGKGAIPPSGGGPVTLICNDLTNNGNIDTSGKKLVSPDGVDNADTFQQYYGIVNGGKGGKGGTYIATPGEIKVYKTGGES